MPGFFNGLAATVVVSLWLATGLWLWILLTKFVIEFIIGKPL